MLPEIDLSSTIACSFEQFEFEHLLLPVESKLHEIAIQSFLLSSRRIGSSLLAGRGVRRRFRPLGRKAGNLFRDVRVLGRLAILFLLAACPLSTVGFAQAPASGGSAKAASSATPSPATDTSSPDRVILKVGDVQITEAQFERYIADLEEQQGPADLSRKALGDNYASMLMLSQQATANHLEASPAVIRLLAIARTQILSNAEFAKLKSEAKPSPEQISEYYNAHLDDYDVVTLRRVFIWKKGPGRDVGVDPGEAEALAAAIRQAYANGSDPKTLVKNPEAVKFDSEPLTFQRGEMPEAMEKVAFGMHKEGEWAELANVSDTLVLLQLVSRSRRTLSAVSPQIEKNLQAQSLNQELSDLKKKSGIWMDQQYFASRAPIPSPKDGPEGSGQAKSQMERGER